MRQQTCVEEELRQIRPTRIGLQGIVFGSTCRITMASRATEDACTTSAARCATWTRAYPGVRVDLDKPVNGVTDCYATHAELRRIWAAAEEMPRV